MLSAKEFKTLFDQKYVPLCLFTNKYINDIEVSKDIVQDVFIKIWAKKITFRDKNCIHSYLYKSVKNKSLDYLKSSRYKFSEALSDHDMARLESDSYFYREIAVIETSDMIDDAINTLPKKCAQIIRLSMKGLTNLSVAEELEISHNTVKAQKKIAYRRLKPLLGGIYMMGLVFISTLSNFNL